MKRHRFCTRQPRPRLFFLIILASLTRNCHGFATYLLTNMGCMTEFSTDEVIMNAHVVAAADSDHPKVHLALVDSSRIQATVLEEINGMITKYRVELSPDDDMQLELQLIADDELHDVQFVVEVDEDSGATMVGGQCEGNRRIAARGQDSVTLQISGASQRVVQLLAGWATGHEAVRLTPPLELEIVSTNTGEGDTNNNKQQKQQEGKGDVPKLKSALHAAKAVEEQSPLPNYNTQQHHHNRATDDDATSLDQQRVLQEKELDKQKRRSSDHRRDTSSRQRHPHKQGLAGVAETLLQHKRNFHRALHRDKKKVGHDDSSNDNNNNNNNSNKIKSLPTVDTYRFLYGVGVLLLGILGVIQVCQCLAGSRDDDVKKRRSV